MRVLSTLAIRAGLLVVTLPKCAKWLIGDSFLFRSEMCESRSLVGEGAERTQSARRVRGSGIRMSWNGPLTPPILVVLGSATLSRQGRGRTRMRVDRREQREGPPPLRAAAHHGQVPGASV